MMTFANVEDMAGYVKLLSTSNKRGAFTARVELDVQRGTTVIREPVTVQPGDDLQQVTGRAVYADSLVQIGRGLAGALIVEEAEPVAFDRDVIWLMQDWRLTADGR